MDQKGKLEGLLGPLIGDNPNKDGYLNWLMLGGSGKGLSDTDLKDSAVYVANLIRGQVGVPNLQWDDQLASEAKNWAQYCATNFGTIRHSDNSQRSGQGENMAGAYEVHGPGFVKGADTTPNGNYFVDAILRWTIQPNEGDGNRSEKDHFDGQTGGVDGHYTQMVWKNTTKFGLGYAIYGQDDGYNGRQVIVCGRFSPPGNYVGQRPF